MGLAEQQEEDVDDKVDTPIQQGLGLKDITVLQSKRLGARNGYPGVK